MKTIGLKICLVVATLLATTMCTVSCKKNHVETSNPLMGYDWVYDGSRDHGDDKFVGGLVYTFRFETDSTGYMLDEFRETGLFGTHVETHPTVYFKYTIDGGQGVIYGDLYEFYGSNVAHNFLYDSVENRVIVAHYPTRYSENMPIPPYTNVSNCLVYKRSGGAHSERAVALPYVDAKTVAAVKIL